MREVRRWPPECQIVLPPYLAIQNITKYQLNYKVYIRPRPIQRLGDTLFRCSKLLLSEQVLCRQSQSRRRTVNRRMLRLQPIFDNAYNGYASASIGFAPLYCCLPNGRVIPKQQARESHCSCQPRSLSTNPGTLSTYTKNFNNKRGYIYLDMKSSILKPDSYDILCSLWQAHKGL